VTLSIPAFLHISYLSRLSHLQRVHFKTGGPLAYCSRVNGPMGSRKCLIG
jgi:hypothetical protein